MCAVVFFCVQAPQFTEGPTVAEAWMELRQTLLPWMPDAFSITLEYLFVDSFRYFFFQSAIEEYLNGGEYAVIILEYLGIVQTHGNGAEFFLYE